jgi:hypothetical protein
MAVIAPARPRVIRLASTASRPVSFTAKEARR